MAGDIITFVDDGRATGATIEHTWSITRQVGGRLQHIGIQDASRKRRPPTRSPGAWAGAVFDTSVSGEIVVTVTQEKWDKGKNLVTSLWDRLSGPDWKEVMLPYKELEQVRGYLCHLSLTYEILAPYLKGFHLILAAHLDRRDSDGWKCTDRGWREYIYGREALGEISMEEANLLIETPSNGNLNNPPEAVRSTEHLRNDIMALSVFFSGLEPPRMQDRSLKVQVVRYGFGDASGTGFGSLIETPEGTKYRIGVWGYDDQEESSNFREFANVVHTIEEEAVLGNLNRAVIFFFTDNSTVESALYKGNSTSQKLFQLVLRFRKLQFEKGIKVVVSHVSGKRMIAQGTDGVSRGTLSEGVAGGSNMLEFIPLHLTAIDRHPQLEQWLLSWIGSDAEVLSPSDWFERGHDHDEGFYDKNGYWRIRHRKGTFIWVPPPAAAEVAVEELRKALIKRNESTHVFVCPRLLTTEWRKQLHKAADLVLTFPAGVDSEGWPETMFEPHTWVCFFALTFCSMAT
jgi:hypothetical protein